MKSFKEYLVFEDQRIEEQKQDPMEYIIKICLYLLKHLQFVYQDDKAKNRDIRKKIKKLNDYLRDYLK